jgi:hypothetical protein
MSGKGGKREGAGRKSKAQKLLDAGFVCTAFGPDVQAKTWKSLLASDDERIVLDTAKYLTDRLYGKAKESHEVSGADGGPVQFVVKSILDES